MKFLNKCLFIGTIMLFFNLNISLTAAADTIPDVEDSVVTESSINTENIGDNGINPPSYWAKSEIEECKKIGLIPSDLNGRYTEAITRRDFCKLIVNTLKVQDSRIIDESNIGNTYFPVSNAVYPVRHTDIDESNTENIYYNDCDDISVIQASALGIVSGVGNNNFNPNGKISRQEAARMLYMAATISDRYEKYTDCFNWKFIQNNKYIDFPHKFADIDKIEYWGALGIQYCFQNNIMFGVNNDMFDPLGTYSYEQAYTTALRLYKRFNGDGIEYEIIRDEDSGLYGYKSDFVSLPCKYEKAYRFREGKAVVCENSVYKLIDTDGNVLIENILENIASDRGGSLDENDYIYDCYGDYVMYIPARHLRTGNFGVYYNAASVYDCTKFAPIWEIDKIHFTNSGDIIRCEEGEVGIVLDDTLFTSSNPITSFRLFSRVNGDLERTDEIYLYKKK